MRKIRSSLICLLICVAFFGTDAGAKISSTKIEENQTAQLWLKSDAKEIESFTGPGILSYYYERDKDAQINPPKGYKKAEIPDKSGVVIEKFEGDKRRGEIEASQIETFYYQFIPGAWEFLTLEKKKSFCYIIHKQGQSRSILDKINPSVSVPIKIDAPATIYYTTSQKLSPDMGVEVDGYQLVTASGRDSLEIFHQGKSYAERELKNLAAVLYPIQGTGSPSASVAPRPSRRAPFSPRTSSTSSNQWEVEDTEKIDVKDGPPY
jgi:hypothetical protein